jgi:hypothetical protein
VSNAFPPTKQSLAGGVFNTVAQIGNSVGLAIAAVIAATVTASSKSGPETSTAAVLNGYRAAWWAELGSFLIVVLLGGIQLFGIGRSRAPETTQ